MLRSSQITIVTSHVSGRGNTYILHIRGRCVNAGAFSCIVASQRGLPGRGTKPRMERGMRHTPVCDKTICLCSLCYKTSTADVAGKNYAQTPVE